MVFIIGMKDIRFNSNPAHISNQLLDEIEISVPKNRVDNNKKTCGRKDDIKDEGS